MLITFILMRPHENLRHYLFYMSIQLILKRAQSQVQRGQIDASIKIYKGLLVSFPTHPQVNTELGVLLLHHRAPEDAVKPLEKAVAAFPNILKLWICLLVAHQKCGNLVKARNVLADMRQRGFPEAQLSIYEKELLEPPSDRLASIQALIDKENYVSAEIAARLLMSDYPNHPAGLELLHLVLEKKPIAEGQ